MSYVRDTFPNGYVMEDTGCSIEEAMEQVYNSPLMTALQDEEGELYVQSPAYLYELMNITKMTMTKTHWGQVPVCD